MTGGREQHPNEPDGLAPDPADRDTRIDDLREMTEDSGHLDEVIADARDAVQAARRADSMSSPGTHARTAQDVGPPPSG